MDTPISSRYAIAPATPLAGTRLPIPAVVARAALEDGDAQLSRRPSVTSSLPPLQCIAGRYLARELIDEGGVALVVAADDTVGLRRVAIKMLKPQLRENRDARERMTIEAHVGRRIHHPNVVELLDDGEHDGLPFLVMELVEGPSLAELIRSQGPLPATTALELIRQASCGLSVMHGLGLIHRDIKPGNLLVAMNQGRAERLKVADLGFAQTSRRITEEGTSVGTLAFMAPEQAVADGVDARTDVYALGVTLFYALTGELPFTGEPRLLMGHQLLSAAPPPSWLASGVSPAVDRIVLTAMRKAPVNRYADITAMRDDIERVLCMRSGAPRGAKRTLHPDRYRPATPLGRQLLASSANLLRRG
jgi:serine/threonine-protein kinase